MTFVVIPTGSDWRSGCNLFGVFSLHHFYLDVNLLSSGGDKSLQVV